METAGISALGISWSAFLFQLINFLALLTVLRIFAYPPIIRVLEARKQKIDEQLKNAAELERKLALAHKKAEGILDASHKKAQGIIENANVRAKTMLEESFEKAQEEAEGIITSANARLEQDVRQAREALRKETATLVASAAEKVLAEKMTNAEDLSLIERALV